MDDATLFERLLQAESEGDVDELLKRADYGLDNEAAWRPLGDMENNFSTVGNQQTEATAALVGIPEHREHRFRPIVNADSGIVNSDSGDPEQRFRAS